MGGKRAVVVAAGAPPDLRLLRAAGRVADVVIAADGGFSHARAAGLRVDVVIGDLDSLDQPLPAGVELVRHPRDKDATDLELALDYVASAGPAEVVLFGALGGRLDHMLATLNLLERYEFPLVLRGAAETLYVVRDQVTVPARLGDLVSLISLSPRCSGISTQGLHYPLRRGTLRRASTRGISNQVTSLPCGVEVREGKLLVVHSPVPQRRRRRDQL